MLDQLKIIAYNTETHGTVSWPLYVIDILPGLAQKSTLEN